MDKRAKIFGLPAGQKTAIKLFTLHPKKPWVAVVTNYNTFSLWNYQQKILIRSFNCNSLDENSNVDIKELIFYDKHCLPYQNQSLTSMKNNIIFATNFKIFFYDYITDGIKQINQTEIEKKNIKKICPYSQTKICIGLSDGSLKLYDNNDSIKNSMTTKTIKGYHNKAITELFAYCQSTNQTPRVISVSGSEGIMACWNLETLISNPSQSQSCSPSFKFQGKSGEIRCFQYDKETYRILTLTDNNISLWSTMTGVELKKIKNEYGFKQIYFFSHFSCGPNSFLGFSGGSQVRTVKISSSGVLIQHEKIDFSNFIEQKQRESSISFHHIMNRPNNPSELFIESQFGLMAIELNSIYRPIFGFNTNFITNLSTINVIDNLILVQIIYNKGIKSNKPIRFLRTSKASQVLKGHFVQLFLLVNRLRMDLLQSCGNTDVKRNSFIYQKAIHQHRKYKLLKPDSSSMLNQPDICQSIIQVCFDGKSFLVFNKILSYYEIYALIEEPETDNLLDLNEKNLSIDFYSKFQVVTKGLCRDIVWHQYKNQYAAICAFDKKNQIVSYQIQKQKKGIFTKGSKGDKSSGKLSGQIDHWCACLFQFSRKSKRYVLVQKSKPIKSQLMRIFNLGTIYCYSSQQKSSMQTIQCICQDQNLTKQVQGLGFFPLRVFVSYCESFQIFVYDNYFVVFKLQQNGYMTYHLTVNEKILQGIFWQKFFIFSTKNEMYFLQLTQKGKILVKIAQSCVNFGMQKSKQAFETNFIDDLEQYVGTMPEGQLQFLTIVNFNLVIINQNENIELFNLKKNPYVQFCIEMICGACERITFLFNHSSESIQQIMKQTLEQYGLSVPTVSAISAQLIF